MPPKAPAAKPSAASKSRSPSPPSKGKAAGKGKAPAGSAQLAPSAPVKTASNEKAPPALSAAEASVLVQAVGRAYLSRATTGVEHKKYLSKKMEKEAEERIFAHSRLERQRREKQRHLQKEEESKEQQRQRLIEALSVAAFDGNIAEMQKLLAQGADMFAKDQQGNNAIGEAAVNGMTEAVRFLLDRGADPNFRGEYERTPMWRAAFNSHTAVIQLLLTRGGDPRLRAQGQIPEELCGADGKKLIADWDLAKTDAMVAAFKQSAAEREETRKKEAQAVADTLTSSADDLKSKLESKRKELLHHKQEFEKRIVEYDIVNNDGTKPADLIQVALDCVKTAEADAATTTAEVNALQEEYFALRTKIALHNHEELGEELQGTEFPFKKLADVVFEDNDNLWTSTGKWPIIFDPSGKARTFLKYRNVIFVDTFSSTQMEPDALRRSVLGALRYGKPMVVDLRDVPMISQVRERLDAVRSGLFDDVLSKRIQEREVYVPLLKQPQDGPELREEKFFSTMVKDARYVFVSSALALDDESVGTSFALLRVDQ